MLSNVWHKHFFFQERLGKSENSQVLAGRPVWQTPLPLSAITPGRGSVAGVLLPYTVRQFRPLVPLPQAPPHHDSVQVPLPPRLGSAGVCCLGTAGRADAQGL